MRLAGKEIKELAANIGGGWGIGPLSGGEEFINYVQRQRQEKCRSYGHFSRGEGYLSQNLHLTVALLWSILDTVYENDS